MDEATASCQPLKNIIIKNNNNYIEQIAFNVAHVCIRILPVSEAAAVADASAASSASASFVVVVAVTVVTVTVVVVVVVVVAVVVVAVVVVDVEVHGSSHKVGQCSRAKSPCAPKITQSVFGMRVPHPNAS